LIVIDLAMALSHAIASETDFFIVDAPLASVGRGEDTISPMTTFVAFSLHTGMFLDPLMSLYQSRSWDKTSRLE